MAAPLTETINPLPQPGDKFFDNLQTFLANEDADRQSDLFSDFVKFGGIFTIGPGLTHTPSTLRAYPSGFRVDEIGSITFTDDTITFVAVFKDDVTTSFIGTWQRVSGTNYIIDVVPTGEQNDLPDGAMYLMEVTTASGSVTVVDDLRPDFPVSQNDSKQFPFVGDAVVSTDIVNKFKFRSNVTIDRIFLGAQTAPTGASLRVGILKNGTLQSQGGILDAGENFQRTNFTPITFSSDDEFGLRFTQVGSTLSGSDIQTKIQFTGGTSISSVEGIEDNADRAQEGANQAQERANQASSSASLAIGAQVSAQKAAKEAAAAVAALNLPTIQSGDKDKILVVNAAEDGYDLKDQSVTVLYNEVF